MELPLKVELRPGERLLVGQCIITNCDQRARLSIEGKAPILREKDILTPDTADSPAKRVCLAVQLMYLQEDIGTLREHYFRLVNDLVSAAPSTLTLADRMNNEILTGNLYKALRTAKELIQYEQDLFEHAALRRGGLPDDSQDD